MRFAAFAASLRLSCVVRGARCPQVADDILDVTASSEELGKTAGKDEEVDKNGGMLVIATSVPDSREWKQWIGRTARQDHAGQVYAPQLCSSGATQYVHVRWLMRCRANPSVFRCYQ